MTHAATTLAGALQTAGLRQKVEAAIDTLIAALDALDASHEDREPSLGWTADEAGTGRTPSAEVDADLEDEHDGREVEPIRLGALA